MAESKTVSIIPLNGANYPSWKLQCRMVLIREGLWGIVAGTEEAPDPGTDASDYAKYVSRRDKALATIILAVATLPHRRPRGSSGCLGKAVWTIPEKDLGEQAESEEEAVHYEVT